MNKKIKAKIEAEAVKRFEPTKNTHDFFLFVAAAEFGYSLQAEENNIYYSQGEKDFQEIQLKGLGIPDGATFEQRINGAIALAWEGKKALEKKQAATNSQPEPEQTDIKCFKCKQLFKVPVGFVGTVTCSDCEDQPAKEREALQILKDAIDYAEENNANYIISKQDKDLINSALETNSQPDSADGQ